MHTAHTSTRGRTARHAQRRHLACAVVALALSACHDERVAPLEARVAELETQLMSVKTDLAALQQAKATPEAPPPPTPIPMLSYVSPPFVEMGYSVGELSADELAAARAPEGFALTRVSPAERLLVFGSLTAAAKQGKSLLGDSMGSFSVVLDARIVDAKSREVKASVHKQVQVLGITPEIGLNVQPAKREQIQKALVDDFKAHADKKP